MLTDCLTAKLILEQLPLLRKIHTWKWTSDLLAWEGLTDMLLFNTSTQLLAESRIILSLWPSSIIAS